ncbi:MAG: glycerol-3-phosphate acyltransferase [Actinomycetota bacterium]|nr:glycerol-3-phosphate acyltransferase [Actinomycetota bacterium]
MGAVAVVFASYLIGAIPFSNVFARRKRGVDLRDVGSKTVSGTSLYTVAGFGYLAVSGVLDLCKGAAAVLLAGRFDHPVTTALAAAAAVAGHNWSPFIGGAGGRGVSVSLGASAAYMWPGTAVLGGGLAVGRLASQTGLGCFVAQVAIVPVLGALYGGKGVLFGSCLTVPMLAKRVLGNEPPEHHDARMYASRLFFDRDATPIASTAERA